MYYNVSQKVALFVQPQQYYFSNFFFLTLNNEIKLPNYTAAGNYLTWLPVW